MNDLTNPMSLTEKLETFLTRACAAEADGDYREANRLFRMALRCEGMLRTDVTDYKEYADEAGSVYPELKLPNDADIVALSRTSL